MSTPVPELDVSSSGGFLGAAATALWDLTLILRKECPWDQAQTASTIVPHTLEEAWEVTDAANAAQKAVDERSVDRNSLLDSFEDELGDLLFQVYFLSMWCDENSDGKINLSTVTRRVFQKLVRRHPHVFSDAPELGSEDEVLSQWDKIKRTREDRSLFSDLPTSMPALVRAKKTQSKAANIGFEYESVQDAIEHLESELAELKEAVSTHDNIDGEIGDVLFSTVNVARMLKVEPEIAVAQTTKTFKQRVELAIQLAADAKKDFETLSLEEQEAWYQKAKSYS